MNDIKIETIAAKALFAAIDEINEAFPVEKHLGKSNDSPLIGPKSTLDSLGATLLIVALEEKLSRALGKNISLTDYMLQPPENNPLATVGALLNHIEGLA